MTRLALSLFLLLATAPSLAADPWSNADKAREAVYLTLHVVDWGQSLDIAKRPDAYNEENFILGTQPSVRRVNTHFAVTAALHVAAVHVMPSSWRPVFQYLWIATEAGFVCNNYRIGLRMNF
jgi:hypothetical protein